MRTARTVTTTTLFSLTPFRQNLREIIGIFESHMKGQHSNLARRATQSYAVQLPRATECCYVELLRGATHCSAELRSATQSYIELRRATLDAVQCCATQCHAELHSAALQNYGQVRRPTLCFAVSCRVTLAELRNALLSYAMVQ